MKADTTIIKTIDALRRMSVSELQAEWLRQYQEPSRSRNKDFLYRRLAWRIQELAHGGLSDATRDAADRLAPDSFSRARTPDVLEAGEPMVTRRKSKRDPRLPPPGSVLVRAHNGTELRLTVHDDHFEMDGQVFKSLSEAARHATGSKWNGYLFWGLTKRSRK